MSAVDAPVAHRTMVGPLPIGSASENRTSTHLSVACRAVGSRHFRAGVVAVVRRPDGWVLAFERADVPGSWQLPQGGLERAEAPVDAVWRELGEETGLGPDDVELRGEHPEWLLYQWPANVVGDSARLGQVHRWFFFAPRRDEIEPTPDGREFRAWRWADPNWLAEHVVPFRRPAYRAGLLGPAARTPTGS